MGAEREEKEQEQEREKDKDKEEKGIEKQEKRIEAGDIKQVRVNDEFVGLNSVAVLKCRPVGEFLHLLEWFTSDGLLIQAGETTGKGNKFVAFKSGELHVNNVEPSDLRRTYGCRLRNSITGKLYSSSGQAQLLSVARSNEDTDNDGAQLPQVIHTTNQLIGFESSSATSTAGANYNNQILRPQQSTNSDNRNRNRRLLLPCAIRQSGREQKSSELRWFFQPTGGIHQIALHRKSAQPIEQMAAQHSIPLMVFPTSPNNNSSATRGNQSLNNGAAKQIFGRTTKLIVGPSFLAIERPTSAQSGRYSCQLHQIGGDNNVSRTMCDINVIIRQAIKLQIELSTSNAAKERILRMSDEGLRLRHSDMLTVAAAQTTSEQPKSDPNWSSWLKSFLRGSPIREKRNLVSGEREWKTGIEVADLDREFVGSQIVVRGQTLIESPPIVQVGQRLQIDCRAQRGYPIEGVKWFRNGRAMNTQSSSDFQIEIKDLFTDSQRQFSEQQDNEQAREQLISDEQERGSKNGKSILLSSLIINQVQPKDVGPIMFECFAFNSLGERARAGKLVVLAERSALEEARAACPVRISEGGVAAASNDGDDEADDEDQEEEEDADRGDLEDVADRSANSNESGQRRLSVLMRQLNPIKRALLLESEPVELVCPLSSSKGQLWNGANVGQTTNGNNATIGRVEWRKWTPPTASSLSAIRGNKQAASETSQQAKNFNQLFSANSGGGGNGGDSRFVINGSSLQMRAPNKRHDEAIYVCQRRLAAAAANGSPISHTELANGRQSSNTEPVHQSSSSSSSCGSALANALAFSSPAASGFGGEPMEMLSSISIRIVAKPKIDPFEFSRNLEEGMRTVLVCTIVSGQSPVEITWFKDANLLLADELVSVDKANAFSSTLTFNSIRPNHSGLYTCVASNAFASTNHSSRLTVNVAPYFIEPPKNTKAILNSNVIINCRVGGQPNPQVRWRKLIAINQRADTTIGGQLQPLISTSKLAPPSGSLMMGSEAGALPSNSIEISQMAQQQQQLNPNSDARLRYEFRVVTSNSHIQILENGSMIIKDIELNDASRYICQAFNGIEPSLSELIDLQVLSPARFEVNYETVGVRRDAMVKFNCAPKGDQPMRIEWRKEANLMLVNRQLGEINDNKQQQQFKYSEIAYLATNVTGAGSASSELVSSQGQRHSELILSHQQPGSNQTLSMSGSEEALKSSILFINYADRGDTGTFVCAARNAYGRDELTYRLIVQEAPDAPANIHANNVQSNSLKLSWPAPFDGNLPVSHFVIEYRQLSNKQEETMQPSLASEWARLVVSASKLTTAIGGSNSVPISLPVASDSALESHQTLAVATLEQSMMAAASSASAEIQKPPNQQPIYSIVLRQLNAKTTYQIRVAAMNSIGQGSVSPQLTVTTAEEPPNGRPNDLRAQPISSSSIKVLWRAPAVVDEQAPIRGYYISHRLFRATSTASATELASLNQHQQTQPWISTSSLSATNYSTQPLSPIQDSLSSFKSGSVLDNKSTSNYEHLLERLDKSTKYEIRVQPYNSMGVGPASETVGQTLKFDRPSAPNLKLVATRRQSMEFKWTLGDDQPLMGFSLFYKCEYDDWQEIQLALIYHYMLENLRCGNKYQVYLSAFNAVGRSDPSDVLSVRTEGTVPIAPDKSQFFRSNITEAILDMSGWQSGGCPISSFMIQFKRLHDSNWFILSEGATPFSSLDKITIPDLAPATWYKLLVTALNEAGSTNAEYLFSTLSINGEPIAAPFPLDPNNSESNGRKNGHYRQQTTSSSMLASLSQFLFASSSSGNSSSQVQQQLQATDAQLLLPLGCLLLLLVTSLATYLYYSRSLVAVQRGRSSPVNSLRSPGSNCIDGTKHQQQHCQLLSGSLMQTGAMHCNSNECDVANLGPQRHYHRHHSATLGRQTVVPSPDEKQLIQSSTNQLHQLISSSTACSNLTLDAHQSQKQQTMLDSLLGHSSRSPQSQSHSLRLLSSANNFFTNANNASPATNTNSSSQSTHSTNCFDGAASSQGSSSGASCVGAVIGTGSSIPNRPKLQLIDESSLISSGASATDQQLAAANNNCQLASNDFNSGTESPARTLYSALRSSETVGQQQISEQLDTNRFQEGNYLAAVSDDAEQGGFVQEGRCQFGIDPELQQRLYGVPNANQQTLLSSASFASAADLLQRQQYCISYQLQPNQQQQGEPIYQRLDKFQSHLMYAKPRQESQGSKSQTLRFNDAHFSSFDDQSNLRLGTMTLHRSSQHSRPNYNYNRTHKSCGPENDPLPEQSSSHLRQCTADAFYPAPPPMLSSNQSVQQPANCRMDQSISYQFED